MTEKEHEALEDLISSLEASRNTCLKPSFEEVSQTIYFLKCLSGQVSETSFFPMITVPKDHTMVKLLVSNPDCPLEDLGEGDLHWTTGHCGFDHDENPNFIVVGWSWSHDIFVNCELTPDRVFGWLPFQVLHEGNPSV